MLSVTLLKLLLLDLQCLYHSRTMEGRAVFALLVVLCTAQLAASQQSADCTARHGPGCLQVSCKRAGTLWTPTRRFFQPRCPVHDMPRF